METKEQIRKRHITQRNQLSIDEVDELSKKICKNLQKYLNGQKERISDGIYGYYPHRKEVSLIELYRYLLTQKIPLAFPRVSGNDMAFYQVYSMEELEEGAFHIMEPKKECPMVCWESALCLVPGSVFDRQGNRYGYGKGYYDRYFAVHNKLYRVGIAYGQQMEEKIPAEATDIKMNVIVSEHGIQ